MKRLAIDGGERAVPEVRAQPGRPSTRRTAMPC